MYSILRIPQIINSAKKLSNENVKGSRTIEFEIDREEAKLTKTSKVYVNTQGEKGKRYYYKARVLVYDQNGKPVTW